MKLIEQSFAIAVQILRAKTAEELSSAKVVCEEQAALLQARRQNLAKTPDAQMEFLFDMTLLKFLNTLALHQATILALPIEQKEFNDNCRLLATTQKVGLNTNTMRMMRSLMKITALIFNFHQLDDTTNELTLCKQSLEIMLALYEFKNTFEGLPDEVNHGMEASAFGDLKTCVSHIVQGDTIKDHAPQSPMQEYISIIQNCFINKLLQCRHVSIQMENANPNNILAIDTLLWRLNLHKHQTIRTILSRYISGMQLMMSGYLTDKMYEDTRQRMIVSILIGEANTQVELRHQFKKTIDYLFANMEVIYQRLYLLINLRIDKSQNDEVFDIESYIENGARFLLFEAELLKASLHSLHLPHCDAEIARLNLLISMAASIIYQVPDNADMDQAISLALQECNVSEIPLDWMTKMLHSDAISSMLCLRLMFQIKNDSQAVNSALHDLNILLERLSKIKDNKVLVQRLILNVYVQFKLYFKSSQSPELTELAKKMRPLQQEKQTHFIQAILLRDMGGEIKSEAKANEYMSVMNQLRGSHETSIYTLQLFFSHIHSLVAGSITTNNREHNTVSYTIQLAQEYFLHRRLEVCNIELRILRRNVQLASFDIDLNVEVACTYPDEKNYIANLYHIIAQMDAATDNETILQLKAQFEAREDELAAFESEFTDLFGEDYQTDAQYQTEAHEVEKNLLLLLKAMLSRKLTTDNPPPNLDQLEKYSRIHEREKLITGLGYVKVYISLMLHFIEYQNQKTGYGSRSEFLSRTDKLLRACFVAMVMPVSDVNLSYMKNIPMAHLNSLRNDFSVLKSPDYAPTTPMQKHLHTELVTVIDKLLETRSEIEASMSDREKQDPKKAVDAFRLRYDLGYLDMLVANLNLSKHSSMRQRYAKLKKESINLADNTSTQHLHPVSQQVTNHKDENEANKQLNQLIEVAIRNCYECVYAFNAIALVDTSFDKSSYQTLQQSIIVQLNFIFRDCIILFARSLTSNNRTMELLDTFSHLELANSVSYATLDHDEILQWMKPAPLTKTFSIPAIDSDITLETITTALNKQMRDNCDLESALALATSFTERFIDLINTRGYSTYLRAQALTDIYLNILMQCDTIEKYESVISSTLHQQMMKMPIADYLIPARDLIIDILKFLCRDQVDSFDPNALSEHEFARCIQLLTDFCKGFDKANKIYVNSDREDEYCTDKQPVYMNSVHFIFLRDVAALLLERSNAFNPTALREIEKHYVRFLGKFSAALQPERLGLNLISMKSASVVKSSFIAEVKPAAKGNKAKPAAKPQKTKARDSKPKAVETNNKIDFSSLCERYDNNYSDVAYYCQYLLNHHSHRIRNDQMIKLPAILSLAEALSHLQGQPGYEKLLGDLILHVNFLVKLQAPATAEQVFATHSEAFKRWIEPHLPKEAEKIVKVRVVVKREISQKQPVLSKPNIAPTVNPPPRIAKPAPVRKLFVPHADDVFHDIRKKMPLHSIIVTEDEKRLMKFLHTHNLHPLIAGEAVRNAIRRIPYASLQAVCFQSTTELKKLLTCHLLELNIATLTESDNRVQVVFKAEKHASLTINCLDPSNKSRSLYHYAYMTGVGVEIFYCLHTQNIIDPCRLYTRIKNNVLDTPKLFDDKTKVADLYSANPEKMLVAVMEESRCRQYGIALECSALRNLIISLSYMLTPTFTSQRLSFDTFDHLFIKGTANFACLHLEYDVMNRLFPVFRRSTHDSTLISNACQLANERYQKWVSKEHPTLRIHDELNEDILFEFRVAFINDLLRDKFLSTHYLGRYVVEGQFFHHQSLGDDITAFLAQCNMPYDDRLLISLEKRWSSDVIALRHPECTRRY